MEPKSSLASVALHALSPIGMLLAVIWLEGFINDQINTSGRFSSIVESSVSVAFFIALCWLFWLVCTGIAEWLILSPAIPDQSLNASLLRLAARIISIFGITTILAVGADNLGLPVSASWPVSGSAVLPSLLPSARRWRT